MEVTTRYAVESDIVVPFIFRLMILFLSLTAVDCRLRTQELLGSVDESHCGELFSVEVLEVFGRLATDSFDDVGGTADREGAGSVLVRDKTMSSITASGTIPAALTVATNSSLSMAT